MQKKSKITAALLSFFGGSFGVHRFYLGQVGRGFLYLFFFWISWIIAFFDGFVFLMMSDDEFDRKYNPWLYSPNGYSRTNYSHNFQQNANAAPKYSPTPQKVNKYEKVLRAVRAIQLDIEKMIEKSSSYDNQIVSDIKAMMKNYVTQVEQLIERGKKLQLVTKNYAIDEVDKMIANLEEKQRTASSDYLREEYMINLKKYKEHRKSYTDLQEQREVIRMRVNSSIMSLKQIKLDLARMESMPSFEDRDSFLKSFDEKSKDLSNYLDFLEKSYNQ